MEGALRRSISRIPLLNSQVFARRGDGLAVDGEYDKNISVTILISSRDHNNRVTEVTNEGGVTKTS